MPVDRLSRAPLLCLAALALATACGGRDAARTEDDPSADVSADAPPAGAEASPSDGIMAPLAVADIDRWEKGIAGELAAVQAAAARLKTARNGEDTMSAMMGVQDMNTAEAGAKAAGVDLERYKVIRSNLSAAASYMTPELGGIDTTMLSPAQRTEMRQMNEAQLKQLESAVPATVIDALRPRASALRKQDLELVGARLKGAGMM